MQRKVDEQFKTGKNHHVRPKPYQTEIIIDTERTKFATVQDRKSRRGGGSEERMLTFFVPKHTPRILGCDGLTHPTPMLMFFELAKLTDVKRPQKKESIQAHHASIACGLLWTNSFHLNSPINLKKVVR